MARSALLLVAAAFCCCAVALPVARHWGGTGSPAAGWVSGCAVWFPATEVWCDYHWSAGGERFTARMRGADRPDGRPATVWIDPDDPEKAVSGKSVTATAVALGACGLLLAACSVAVTRTRRAVAFVLALAVAAVPAAAVLARAERRPGPDGVPPAAPAPLAPALRGERPV